MFYLFFAIVHTSITFRLIFWTEVEVERIGKAFMDGTSKKYIITNKIRWPNGVAIDFTGKYFGCLFQTLNNL